MSSVTRRRPYGVGTFAIAVLAVLAGQLVSASTGTAATARFYWGAHKSSVHAAHTRVLKLHRKARATCTLRVTNPHGKARHWTYPAVARVGSFAFTPTKKTTPGRWAMTAKCVPTGTTVTRTATTHLRVLTGHHGHAFLVGKSGPAYTVLVGTGTVTGGANPPTGGKGGDPGDDYPYRTKIQDSGVDPWGEDYRECTSFVAWALWSRNQFTMPFHADAYLWGIKAKTAGYPVNNTPAVGAVAWEPQLPNHYWGHVMWVSAVNGSQVTVEEYNEHGNGTYDQRTFSASSEPYQYIHFKDLTHTVPNPPTPTPPTNPPSSTTYLETTGSVANTWTNFTNAGGTEGPSIGKNATVQIACKVTGFTVADGNTWWYQIASSPWSKSYYVSADAFYNNGATSGSLKGTPFYDTSVPNCTSSGSGTPTTWAETTGSVAHTWTNPANAGGTEGAAIGKNATVQIACRLTGFKVADGNTWWYKVASAPWSDAYYVSADAFYNNGATSGSLSGTPFVDTKVATC